MKNINNYFLSIAATVFFTIGTVLMLFSNTFISGGILLIIGFITSLFALKQKNKYFVEDKFLIISAFLSLAILVYNITSYSKNVIIISISFYALIFLIQVNSINRQEKKVTTIRTIKKSVKEFKEDLQTKKHYYYTKTGKAFHLAGCISLSRTPQEKIKKSNSRDDLISKGYKTCKVCNS